MMKLMKYMTSLLAMLLAVAVGALFWQHQEMQELVGAYVENGDFLTLEARHSPEDIMEAQRAVLLGDLPRSYQRAILKYHPYLMLEVKYTTPDRKTQEGAVLWSLVDGEILLDTESWERSHGYYDALMSGANRSDFKLLYALARHSIAPSLEQLQRELRLDDENMEMLISGAKAKQLIVQKGNSVQLHFLQPKLLITPQTSIRQRLVTKPYGQVQRLVRRFTPAQIEEAARAAFGGDFAIRATHEVLLPFYAIEVLNPDGSVMTSFWNALTGQRLPTHLFVAQ